MICKLNEEIISKNDEIKKINDDNIRIKNIIDELHKRINEYDTQI